MQLPRDATSSIALEPEAGFVSEVFRGNLCDRNPQSTVFTPGHAGLFRLTSYRLSLFEADPFVLLVNGVTAIPAVTAWTDYEVQARTPYELKVSGDTSSADCPHGRVYDGSFRITYLRPR